MNVNHAALWGVFALQHKASPICCPRVAERWADFLDMLVETFCKDQYDSAY